MIAASELHQLHELLVAHVPGWSRAFAAGDAEASRSVVQEVDLRSLVRTLGQAGWVMPAWPVDHGGRGLSEGDAADVHAELDRWGIPRTPPGAGLVFAAPTILLHSSEETKRRWLPPMASGEERWCQLFSEPGAGSDLSSLGTTAVRDGDEWVINGQKVWTSLGHESEIGMLLARTDPTVPKHEGITYFGLDLRLPGVEVRPLRQMTGESEFNEVFLHDVRIPDVCRISAVGDGWAATQTTLSAERHALSGIASKRKASDEILGGKTIEEVLALAVATGAARDGARRDLLMREYVRSTVLAWTTRRANGSAPGVLAGPGGSLTKLAKARANQSLQCFAVALLGTTATAWADEPGAEEPGYVRELLRTRANSIEGGTSEIQRNIVGERILGLPREPDPYRGRPWTEVPRA